MEQEPGEHNESSESEQQDTTIEAPSPNQISVNADINQQSEEAATGENAADDGNEDKSSRSSSSSSDNEKEEEEVKQPNEPEESIEVTVNVAGQ